MFEKWTFEFPWTKNALCQVWLKLAMQISGKIFLNVFDVILLFIISIYLSLKRVYIKPCCKHTQGMQFR